MMMSMEKQFYKPSTSQAFYYHFYHVLQSESALGQMQLMSITSHKSFRCLKGFLSVGLTSDSHLTFTSPLYLAEI